MSAASGRSANPVVRWHAAADVAAIHDATERAVLDAAAAATAARGRFVIVLAGGNTPRGLYERLCHARTDWSTWHVWFGDERCVPRDDTRRNSRMAGEAWLDHVAIPADQVHPIPAEAGPVAAASRYGEALADVGTFDVVLLGLGEDGHTASLFPGQDAGLAADGPAVVAVFDAPKPPPQRVSLGAARLSDSRTVIFVVTGEGKREAVSRWRAGEAIPAAAVLPPDGVDVFVEECLLRD